ncbi:MAG: repeat-containing protein [Planctomycetaceae bacterium]|nr:repeat-containing protein [Planctomycetaceae bacterium]
MAKFHWSHWVLQFMSAKGRKGRRASVARIEGLEDRALLTANLPLAVNDIYAVDQNTTLTATTSVLANDTDADGDTISEAVLQNNVTHGSLTLNTNGTFTYTPTTGFSGSDSFTYLAKDATHNELSASPATVTLNVTTNAAPTVSAVTLSTTTNTAVSGTLTGTDANGDTLTFAEGATTETNGTVAINPTGAFTFTPTAGFTGVATFSYRANDGSLNSNDATVTINVNASANSAPVVNPVTLSTTTNTAVSGTLTGTDANGDTLTFAEGSTTETHGTVVINPNGSFTFTPTAGFTGTATFSYKANDGSLNSNDATVTINVSASANTAPVVNPVTLSTTTSTAVSGTLTGTDANGDTLTFFEGSTAETHGTVVINPNGSFTFTPTAGFTGAATFSYKANDGSLNSNDATVTINVSASANTAPVVNAVTVSTTTSTAVSGTLTGTDANGDSLTFSEGSTTETHGTVFNNPNGSFTFTPTAGVTGVATFSYKANDGTLNSSDATVTVNVLASANTVPAVINGTGTTGVNAALNGSLVSLATDAEGDTLTFAAASQPANGTVNVNSNGTFTFTPDSGFVGTTSFTFTASDGSLTSTPATFTIVVSDLTQGSLDLNLAESVDVSSNPSSPTPLDPTVTLTNVASGTNFANAQLNVSFVSGVDSKKDRLVVIKHGGAVEVKGKKVLVDGTQVATITSSNRKGSALHVNFNSSATEASVNAVLQRIAIQTRPSTNSGIRVVQFQVVADGTTATDTIQASVTGSGRSHRHG